MAKAVASRATFTEGSTLRHITVMTLTSAFGLFAIMLVDFIDLLYIKALGTAETAAAIGFAGNILFYLTSINIGISIASGVMIGRSLGAGKREDARQIAADFFLLTSLGMTVVGGLLWWFTPEILNLLGATGEAHGLATSYLRIMWMTSPVFVLGFVAMAALRAVGDARSAMNCTLAAAVVNAILDPIFIFDQPMSALGIDAAFGLGMGVDGAAWSSNMARLAMVWVGVSAMIKKHDLVARLDWHRSVTKAGTISTIAVPAMLTNFATPVGDSFITRAIASFGDDAVSAYAVIGRIIAIAFSVTFSLSGAVGPILAQNLGAKLYDRVQRTMWQSIAFAFVYIVLMASLMLALEGYILRLFNSTGVEANLISFFLHWVSFSFFFVAIMFICNACFNNTGKPTWATALNFARALGAAPLAFWAADVAGPEAVLAAQASWTALVSLVSLYLAHRLLSRLACGDEQYVAPRRRNTFWRIPVWNYGTTARPPAIDERSYQPSGEETPLPDEPEKDDAKKS